MHPLELGRKNKINASILFQLPNSENSFYNKEPLRIIIKKVVSKSDNLRFFSTKIEFAFAINIVERKKT